MFENINSMTLPTQTKIFCTHSIEYYIENEQHSHQKLLILMKVFGTICWLILIAYQPNFLLDVRELCPYEISIILNQVYLSHRCKPSATNTACEIFSVMNVNKMAILLALYVQNYWVVRPPSKSVQSMRLNYIRWWGSRPGALANLECLLIDNTPGSTQIRISSTG